MSNRDTAGFLQRMNEANARIAEQEEERSAGVGLDPVRERTDAERRERYGQLRARAKHRSKTARVHSVFGYSDPS